MSRTPLLALISFLILSVGCASFQENKIPEVNINDIKSLNKDKIKVFSRWKYQIENSNDVLGAAAYKSWFDKSVKESGCCILVEGPTEAQLVVNGLAYGHSNSWKLLPIIINGMTFTIIPYWETFRVDIKVQVSKDKIEKVYSLDDSFVYVSWLPMIFAFPFTGGPTKNKEYLYNNTYRNLIIQLKQDGIL